MTSHDSGDDGDDDAQLKSLRAVWLSMPDEEPPERGLAELMAAARTKAEQMTKPSLWERISALLRRPPVLALATVLVLIGGAVFIGQRRSKMEAPQEVTQERARDTAAAGSAAVAPANTVAAPESPPAEGAAPPSEQLLAEPTPEAAASKKDEVAPKVEQPARHRTPTASSGTKSVTTKAPTASTKFDSAPAKTAPVMATDSKETKKPETRGFDDSSLIEGEIEEKPSSDKFASPPPAAAEAPADVAIGGAKGTVTTAPEVSRSQQYIKQAKSAAARKDCNTARVLMKRVASEDAASYRKAIDSDAALKKCFE